MDPDWRETGPNYSVTECLALACEVVVCCTKLNQILELSLEQTQLKRSENKHRSMEKGYQKLN